MKCIQKGFLINIPFYRKYDHLFNKGITITSPSDQETSGICQGINLTTFSWGSRSGVDLGRLAEECVAEVFHFSLHSLNLLFSYISRYWGCYYKVWQMLLFCGTPCLVLLNLVSSSKGPALTWQNIPAPQTHHPVINI